jgi:hypothetical protein
MMKTICKKLSLAFMALLFMYSCDNFMDVHKDYIKDGEIIYAPKVDSIEFVAGEGRMLFRAWLLNSPNVKSINIYWNSYNDSLIIPVSPSAGLDSVEAILPNMPERAYTFDIHTVDNFGHPSLLTTGFGTSYGESFRNILSNRRVRTIDLTDIGGMINWFSAGDNLVATEIRYTDKNNRQKTVSVSANESSVLCPEIKSGSKFEYRSSFIPEDKSIDTFYVDWIEYETAFPEIFMYDRSEWSILDVSDETASDGGGKNTLIDNDLGSYWHSQWDGGDAPLPHWAVIDMVSPKEIIKIETYRRSGSTDSKTVRYFVGDSPDPDAATWTQIAEGEFTSGNLLTIDIPQSVNTLQGRYLKLYLPDSNRNPFTSIAEIYLYGE